MENHIPSIDKLFEDFNHPNPNINQDAFILMAKYWPNESLPRLVQKMYSNDLSVRRKAVKALSVFGLEILPNIVKLFSSTPDQKIRLSCLKVLVKLAMCLDSETFPDDVMQIIETAFEDDRPETILTVISILRQMGIHGLPLLMRASKDNNILKASAAVTALSEIDNPQAIKWLKDLSEDQFIDKFVFQSMKMV